MKLALLIFPLNLHEEFFPEADGICKGGGLTAYLFLSSATQKIKSSDRTASLLVSVSILEAASFWKPLA